MLAVMFIAFLIQILFRYVLNWPAGWASELSTVMWIWLVLWGAAFVVRERDEIRFDIFYGSVAPRAPGPDDADRHGVVGSSCSRCPRCGTTSPS
jgi:TRAP-type C4-dicarboxylate transport system permease small subunit